MTPPPELTDLRQALDAVLVGQEEAKTGLLLGWLACEHVYLEGPPGCGKTLLAEAFAQAVGGRFHAIRFHRDLREQDWIGESLLQRTRLADSERIVRSTTPGPLLQARMMKPR